MRVSHLWATASMLLFMFALSCSTSDQKKDDSSQSKDAGSLASPNGDTTVSPFEADSIIDVSLLSKLYTFPVEADSTVTFCGGLKNTKDKIRLRFTIYYSKQGKAAKKQASFKIKGDDKFQFKFTAVEKGELHLLIEEEKSLNWKNLKPVLSPQVPTPPDECCIPPTKKKAFLKRKNVGTQGGTGDGGSTDVYE